MLGFAWFACLDKDVLLRECLDSADVGAGVSHADAGDDQHPVVVRLVEDGEPLVPAEGQVGHSQQVQGGVLSPHRPGDNGELRAKIFRL